MPCSSAYARVKNPRIRKFPSFHLEGEDGNTTNAGADHENGRFILPYLLFRQIFIWKITIPTALSTRETAKGINFVSIYVYIILFVFCGLCGFVRADGLKKEIWQDSALLFSTYMLFGPNPSNANHACNFSIFALSLYNMFFSMMRMCQSSLA